MGEAIGSVLALAMGVALSPIPIIAVTLMLISRRARVNGPVFLLGWILGLAIVGVVVLGIANPADASEGGEPATWVNVLKILLGVAVLRIAHRQWQKRPAPGDTATMPKWMATIDDFTPAKAGGAGVVLSAANPKNLLLAVAAAAAISQTGVSGGEQAIAYAVFVLIATIGPAIPVVIYFALGDRAPALLERLKAWLGIHNNVIMMVLCLIIGFKLIGDGIGGF